MGEASLRRGGRRAGDPGRPLDDPARLDRSGGAVDHDHLVNRRADDRPRGLVDGGHQPAAGSCSLLLAFRSATFDGAAADVCRDHDPSTASDAAQPTGERSTLRGRSFDVWLRELTRAATPAPLALAGGGRISGR